jgi:hypothetical protein
MSSPQVRTVAGREMTVIVAVHPIWMMTGAVRRADNG